MLERVKEVFDQQKERRDQSVRLRAGLLEKEAVIVLLRIA